MSFTIGADPEIFIGDKESVRSVIGKIGGRKNHPLPLRQLGEGFAVQEDGVALEFNIPACKDKKAFVDSINRATGFLEKLVGDMYGMTFDRRSAVSFPESEFYDPAALEFGCMPDYNAWTMVRNPRPECEDKNLRSCGGHVHIGFDDVSPISVIKACDLFLGVSSVLMDKGDLRRKLYGKAGAFRHTKYGAEYRSLSNFWIFDPRLVGWVYDNTERALNATRAGLALDAEKDTILDAIDNNNKDVAAALVKRFKLDVVNV